MDPRKGARNSIGGEGRTNDLRRRLEALRSSDPDGTEDRLFLATLRIRIPKNLWTGRFSTAHPSVRMEALNRTDVTKDVSVSDYWVSGQPPGVWAREISSYSDVEHVESISELADGCIYRVTYRNPPVVYLYRKLRLPLQFPLRMQGGYLTWEVVARRAEFDEVLQFARSRTPEVSIVSIRRRPLRSHLPLLTDSQQQLLTNAMAAGYFAVPRAITLTDLAKQLGRSKSSVSESLAHIERKLLESAIRPSGAPS